MSISAAGGGLAAGYIENLTLVSRGQERAGRLLLLPPRPAELAGREELLAVLHDRLSGGGPQPRIAALHGMGGAGKTSVAVEYAHRHESEFGVVCQFAAEDRIMLEAGFARLSALLAAAGSLAELRDPVGFVHAVLADSQVPWLLIFDNVPDPTSVREFLPGCGPGQVLITSQHALWPAGQGIEVPVLEADVAARYLVSRSRDPDLAAARELAAELGGLPLALEQAGAYTEAAGMSLADYCALFNDRRAELLARGEAAGHPVGVAATIGVALSRLEADAAATGLLRLLACLAPEPVPVGLLLSGDGAVSTQDTDVAVLGGLLGDQLAVGDAVAALRRYSLVTPAGAGMVAAHRLVQAVALESMPGGLAAQWRHAAASLTAAAVPESASRPESWPVFAALLPHVRHLLPDDSASTARMASYLGNEGNLKAARDLQARVASARDHILGSQHPSTLTARADLAMWTGRAGDPVAARDMYAALVPVRERLLGPDHPDTLAARSSLAVWTAESGDPAAARDVLMELLPVRERVSGPEHPYTLTTRANLAYYTGIAGDPASARDMCAELLPVRERVSGPEHPYTLTTRGNLARWTGQAGDARTAQGMLTELVAADERVRGPQHPDTLTDRANLAYATGEAGDPAAARDMYAALVPIRERVSGPEHPYTLAARRGLVLWTARAGNLEAAREALTTLVQDYQQVLGPDHPETQATSNQLALWTERP